MSKTPLWLQRRWRDAADRAARREVAPVQPAEEKQDGASRQDEAASPPDAEQSEPPKPNRPRDPDRKRQHGQPPADGYGDEPPERMRF